MWIFWGMNVHMDEFINFHTLAYAQENFKLNQFSEGYQAYVKNTPLGKIYLPFPYVGNLQAFLFYPFYILFPLFWAKAIYGLLNIWIVFYLLLKIFNPTQYNSFLLLLFMPLYVVVMHDAGPVNVSLIIFLWTKVLIEKIYFLKQNLIKWSYIILLSFGWIFAFYDKIFFIYILPGCLLFSIAHIPNRILFSKKSFLLGLPIIVFGLFVFVFMKWEICSTLYESKNLIYACLSQNQYLSSGELNHVVSFLKQIKNGIFSLHELKEILSDRLTVFGIILHQFDFSFYLLRNVDYLSFLQVKSFGLKPYFSNISFIIFLIILLIKGRSASKFFSSNNRVLFFYLLSFFSIVLVFLILGKVRFGHHTIYLWLPILGILVNEKNQFFRKPMILFFSFNMLFFVYNVIAGTPNSEIKSGYHSIEKQTHLPGNEKAIINFGSWNYYYIRSLDNPNGDIVTFVQQENPNSFNRLLSLADSLDLPIIYIGKGSNILNATSLFKLGENSFGIQKLKETKDISVLKLEHLPTPIHRFNREGKQN